MKPMKPRRPGSLHDTLVDFGAAIAASEGESADAGPRLMADFLGLSVFTIYKYLDPDQKGDLSLMQAAQLAARFPVPQLAEHFAQLAGGTFLAVKGAGTGQFESLTGDALQHLAGVAQRIFEAHGVGSDGGADITPREAEAMLPLLLDLLVDVSGLVALARKLSCASSARSALERRADSPAAAADTHPGGRSSL